MCLSCKRAKTHLLYQHGNIAFIPSPIQLVLPNFLLWQSVLWHSCESCRTRIRRAGLGSRRGPLVAQSRFKETRALRQNQFVEEIALLLSSVRDHNLHVASMGKHGELVLGLVRRASKMGSMRSVPTSCRSARRVRCHRGRSADSERALCALRVGVRNHASVLRRRALREVY